MTDMMTFPDTWEEYEKIFGFYDEDGVYYSSNTRLIPSFRVKQWLDHESERKLELQGDESAIEILSEMRSWFSCFDEKEGLAYDALSLAIKAVKANSNVARRETNDGKD